MVDLLKKRRFGMIEKRFEIVKSKLIKDGWVINDKLKQFTFPTLRGDKRALVSYCKALNELHGENEQFKQSQANTLREFEKGTKKIQQLAKENEELKQQREELFIRERDTKNELRELKEENKELLSLIQEDVDSWSDDKKQALCDMLNAILGDFE